MFAVYRLHIELGSEYQVEYGYFYALYDIERRLLGFRFPGRRTTGTGRGSPLLSLSSHSSTEEVPEIELEVLGTSARRSAELREDVLESTEPLSSARCTAERFAWATEGIVFLPFLDIAKGLVGSTYFLEFVFGFLIALVLIRMVLHRELSVCFLYLVLGRGFRDSEDRVWVFFGHMGVY